MEPTAADAVATALGELARGTACPPDLGQPARATSGRTPVPGAGRQDQQHVCSRHRGAHQMAPQQTAALSSSHRTALYPKK